MIPRPVSMDLRFLLLRLFAFHKFAKTILSYQVTTCLALLGLPFKQVSEKQKCFVQCERYTLI
jgi:hypothetical protein